MPLRKRRIISISIDEELLSEVDTVCKAMEAEKKTKFSRSDFITNAIMFLIASSQQYVQKKEKENKED